MKAQSEIRTIAESILESMGGNANQICNGDCPVFAKKLIDLVGYGEIVSNLETAMEDDLSGYEVIEPADKWPNPNKRQGASHCWVKIDSNFYDAFNPEGVDDESLLISFDNAWNS